MLHRKLIQINYIWVYNRNNFLDLINISDITFNNNYINNIIQHFNYTPKVYGM